MPCGCYFWMVIAGLCCLTGLFFDVRHYLVPLKQRLVDRIQNRDQWLTGIEEETAAEQYERYCEPEPLQEVPLLAVRCSDCGAITEYGRLTCRSCGRNFDQTDELVVA